MGGLVDEEWRIPGSVVTTRRRTRTRRFRSGPEKRHFQSATKTGKNGISTSGQRHPALGRQVVRLNPNPKRARAGKLVF